MPGDRPIRLPYGRTPLELAAPPGATVVDLPPGRPGQTLEPLLEEALDAPIGSGRLEELARGADRVAVIVSDATRDDPRAELLAAVRARLPAGARVAVCIANGTHPPGPVGALGIPERLLAGVDVVNHDGGDAAAMVELGATARGTPVRVNRALAEADVIVATGRIKPHYFAGYGAGAKAIFPGLGERVAVRINHRLKTAPGARPGVVEGNPCRDDLEEAARMVGGARFLLNAVEDADGHPQSAVAGDLVDAFRRGAERCGPWFLVRAPRSRAVVVSDALPLTGSLYQASKLVASVAELLLPGGTIVVVAECPEGVGGVQTVNRAIYQIGLAPRLPDGHRIVLVSSLSAEVVAETYCEHAASVEDALARCEENPVIIPRAGAALVEVTE